MEIKPIKKEFIPFGRPSFSELEMGAVVNAMTNGWIGMGPEVESFENELAQYLGVPYVVTVNSCTSALFLSLLALGIADGDEVICPSLTWCSTANSALYLGAKPIFCDVDPKTLSITAESILDKVTPKTKAVIVVHYGGYAVDVKKIRSSLPQHISIVEDAAHALGALYSEKSMVGASGNLTCFSFYANKNLSTGEGGAIALFDESIALRLRSLRQHGLNADAWNRFMNPKAKISPEVFELGYKMNYTDLQASIGRGQLKRFKELNLARLNVAQIFYEELETSNNYCNLEFQTGVLSATHARHLFIVKLPIEQMRITRNEFLIQLRDEMIGAAIHYYPVHLMDFYSDLLGKSTLPVTEDLPSRIITLPISSSIDTSDAIYVANTFNALLKLVIK